MAEKTPIPWLHARIVARASATHTMHTAKTKEGEDPLTETHHWLALKFASGDVLLLRGFDGRDEAAPDLLRVRSQPNPQRAFTLSDAQRQKAGISADTYADLNAGLRASEESKPQQRVKK